MFVDMNGNYEYPDYVKMQPTTVTQNVTPTSDKIYVEDVSKLPTLTAPVQTWRCVYWK